MDYENKSADIAELGRRYGCPGPTYTALNAAEDIEVWWHTDFTPPKSKNPNQEETESDSAFSDIDAGFVSVGIGETAITEINRLIAKNANLNTSKINEYMRINIPVDVRVVINWNMNNTDIDLRVFDPNNEECRRDRRQTSIGGRMSANIEDGYGPEQFLLKKAIKGRYRVYADYRRRNKLSCVFP